MLSRFEYEEVLQMRREVTMLRADLAQTVRDYYARKFDPNQPRKPLGPGGGQWTSDSGGTEVDADVKEILAKAKQLAATHAQMGACVDLCLPLLDRRQPSGSDRNEFAFRKCLNACLGLNR